ncbi:MAG: tetratricopeptide repeat protein, partial [Alphaproteobacteria bacterium]|nr:tetratricopeptide repeat protein [Alphaproteobacteria bacterium]
CRDALRRARELAPDNHLTSFYLANLHTELDETDDAIAELGRACELNPGSADYHNSLGNLLHGSERDEEAAGEYRRALELNPNFAEAHNNLANALVSLKQPKAAVDHYRRSLELNSEQPIVACNLGNVLRNLGGLAESLAAFRRAAALDPKLFNAYNGMGLTLQVHNRHEEAVEAFQQALGVKGDYPEALNNLAISEAHLGRFEEAVRAYGKLLDIRPDLPEALFNLASLLQTLNRWDESILAFMQALNVRPDYNVIYPFLAHSLMQQCNWSNLHGIVERIRRNTEEELAVGETVTVSAFALQSLPGEFSMALRQKVAEQISRRNADYVNEVREGLHFTYPRNRRDERLRIGYLSPDFRFHSVAVAFKGILDNHDRDHFSPYGYALHSGDDDPMTNDLRDGFDGYRNFVEVPFKDAAQQIHDDGIDILVDLAGHTRGAQLELLALRPAPVQVHYLGYSATIGAKFLDYLITDHNQVPPEQRQFFTEQLVYLPDTFMATQRAPVAVETPRRDQCGLPEQGFVFVNFNTHYKIEPKMFGIWMRLLRQIPDAVLWLLQGSSGSIEHLRREAAARGVDPDRLVFAGKVPHPMHLARLRHADLALDNLYHGGGVTTVDCLWVGVPVLSLAGPTPQSRNGASLLSAIGQDGMIQYSLADYERLALELARDPTRLAAIKADLQSNRERYPLFDSGRLTRHLETAYRLMWQRHRDGEAPAMIEVPRLPL